MTELETELWKSFQKGDRKAFEEILRMFYRSMFDYGYRFQKDPDQLSDDIHDLFLNLWDRRMFLKPESNLKLYLFSALRNQIFRKKQRTFTFQELGEEADDMLHENEYAETRMILTESADERVSRIGSVLGKLTRRQQEILHLRFFENLSNAQISVVLNISEPSVYNLLSLSLKLFRKYWHSTSRILPILLTLYNLFILS